MTLQDYLNSLQAIVPNYQTYTSAQITQAINSARQRISEWTDTTVMLQSQLPLTAGTASYALGTFLSKPYAEIKDVWVWLGNTKYPLKRVNVNSFVVPLQSYPAVYWLTPNEITFYPTPISCSVDIKYRYLPANLINLTDGDFDILPVYSQIVSYLSGANLATLDGNAGLAQYYTQLATQLKNEIGIGI